MDGMAAQTRVVLSTAGPFALIGSPVVAAAVRSGCHYVDITGGCWGRAGVGAAEREQAGMAPGVVWPPRAPWAAPAGETTISCAPLLPCLPATR